VHKLVRDRKTLTKLGTALTGKIALKIQYKPALYWSQYAFGDHRSMLDAEHATEIREANRIYGWP